MSATIFPPGFNAGPETPRGKCWAKFGRAKFEAMPQPERAKHMDEARRHKVGFKRAVPATKPAGKAPARKLSAFEQTVRTHVAKTTRDPRLVETLTRQIMTAQHAPAPVAAAAPPTPQLHGLERAIAAHRQQPEIRAEREAREKRIATSAKK